VTDAGLRHLKGLRQLQILYLVEDDGIMGDGFENLEDCQNLYELDLDLTSVSNTRFLRKLSHLRFLGLKKTKITDASLQDLSELYQLESLDLHETSITDAGLGFLKNLKKLHSLRLEDTKVTEAGVAKLRKSLPNCFVFH
jgi:hypothetical protein